MDQHLMDMLEDVPQHVTDQKLRDAFAKELWRVRGCINELRALGTKKNTPKLERILLQDLYNRYKPPLKPTFKNLLHQARQNLTWWENTEPNYGEADTEYYSACGHDDWLSEKHAWLYVMAITYLRAAKEVKNA